MIFKLLLCCVELHNCEISLFFYTDHINLLMKTCRSLIVKVLVPSGHFTSIEILCAISFGFTRWQDLSDQLKWDQINWEGKIIKIKIKNLLHSCIHYLWYYFRFVPYKYNKSMNVIACTSDQKINVTARGLVAARKSQKSQPG